MGLGGILFLKLLKLLLLGRRMILLLKKEAQGEDLLGGPTVNMLLHTRLVPKKELVPGLEKDPVDLPALRRAVQSQTPIPLDLGLGHTLHRRKGLHLCQNIYLMHLNDGFSGICFFFFSFLNTLLPCPL